MCFGNFESKKYGTIMLALCSLTNCGLVTPYGGTDLGQQYIEHWLRKWLDACLY